MFFLGLASLISVLFKLSKDKIPPPPFERFLILFPLAYGLAIIPTAVLMRVTPDPIPDWAYLKTFNQDSWMNFDTESYSPVPTDRQKMIADLIENQLVGKKLAEVRDMLGPSDVNSYRSNDILSYDLGMAPGFQFFLAETEFIDFEFSNNGVYSGFDYWTKD